MRGQKHIFRIRKFLPIFAVVGILAVIGGVFAFNQDSAFFNNLFGVASYESEFIETFESPADWETCQEVPKTVVTKNNSTGNFKVRLSYEEYWRNAADDANLPLVKDGETLALINFQNENDWTRHGNWYYYNYEVEPGDSTNSLFKSVTLNCDANLAKYNVCVDTPTGKECTQPENEYEAATYHLNIKVQTTSGEFPHDEQYHVTLNPNGGTYEGSTDIYDAYLQYGTVIDLDSVTYPEHEIVDWTLNGTESYTESTITVTDDIDLVANWQTSIFHTVTVDPNGGSLDGETQPISTRVREGDNYTLTDTEPTLANHLFTGWTINGQPLTNYTFAVMDDVTITANWGLIIAQNTRTSKLYTSLTNAETEAQSGDTIKLVDNDEEHFTNTKNITLDLNEFVVSGSVTNNGTMTLLNGEIRNEDGVAFTNYGTLTMGIDDHIDENTANVDPDYVRLIGTTTGLDQNGTFYYYDGFIEGEFAFEGGYNGSPYYRNAYDGKTVYYFPLVDSCRDKESCQHVELESSDLAHSKTTVGGDIYYYNIQDNINMSMRTGYKIYIARGDNFATGYGITIPEGADITIDLNGNEMTMTDAIVVSGKLTIEDSKTTVITENVQDNSTALPNISGNVFVTPHVNNTTTTTTYAGIIHTPQTIINSGELVLKKARLEGTSGLDSIQSSGTLSMEAGAIGAASGYTIRPTENAIYNLDSNSYIYSNSSNKAAVYNTLSNFVWDNDGIIYGNRYGIQSSSSDKKVLISNGTVFGKETGVLDSTVTVDGGTVGSFAKGIGGGKAALESGTIRVNNANGSAVGISRYTSSSIGNEVVTMNGGEIIVTSGSSSSAIGIESHIIQSGGTITVTNNGSGAAYGICNDRSDGSSKGTIVNDGTISAQANSGNAFGIYARNAYIFRVEDGNISGTSTSGTGYGINGIGASENVVKGGTVYGSTYGIYNTNAATPTVLGTNGDEVSTSSPEIIGDSYALYNGAFYFYDGVLRGKTGAYRTGVITAIPDGYTYHTEETASYKENCWLVPAENYLHVVGGGDYNSLSKAYEAITGDTGTIEVTQDTAAEAAHPSSPQGKTITFDLKGHTLNYTQPIINGGTMILEDSSQGKTGKLINANTAQPAITNNGNLTINSGDYSSKYRTVQNNDDSTFTLSGGALRSSLVGIYNNGSYNNSTGRYMDHPANVYINGGEVIVESSNSSIKYGINNATQGQNFVNITGGKITVKNEQSGTSCDLYGIASGTITINAPAGQLTLDVNNANGLAKGIGGGLVTLESGTISVQSANKAATGISRYTSSGIGSNVVTMNGGEIIVTGGSSNSESIKGIESHVIQSGGTITVTNNGSGAAYGIYDDRYDNESKGVIIDNGTISAQANRGSAFGASVTGNIPVFRMTDGNISGASTSGTGYGIYGAAYKEYTVKDGAIHGSTYGIYNTYASRPATLGANGDAVSTSSPEIIGDSYALYNGAFYFYDGVLRGKTGAYSEGVVKQIADDTTVYIEHQTIGGDDYEVRYLIAEYDVAKIGDTKYKKLSSAIEAANTGDNIEILADIYAFDTLTISAEKDITIDTKGFDFYISSSITNNGQVSIVNNSAKKTTVLKYSSPDYAIINNTSGTLSIEKMALDVNYGINNSGSLTLDDVSIDADNTAINNIGDITADNINISGTEYSLYNDGGNSTIENSVFSGKYLYNNSGTLNLNNSTAERSDSSTANISDYVTNKGTLNLDSTTIARVGICSGTSSNHCRSLYNTGNLSMSNSSTVSNTTSNPGSYLYSKVSTIINDGGNITVSDSSVLLSISNVSSGYYTTETQSIRNNSGSIAIESGTVSASGPGRVYGIYNDTGNITLGIAEPSTSPDYGRDTANVSKTNPAITAISTTNNSGYKIGIGIKNNTGKTYFYDGKITGTSTAMPEAPTETEYLYETSDYIDENTGNQYRILEWIRQQPSPGGE